MPPTAKRLLPSLSISAAISSANAASEGASGASVRPVAPAVRCDDGEALTAARLVRDRELEARARRAVQEQQGEALRVAVDARPEPAPVRQRQPLVADPVGLAGAGRLHCRASSRSNSNTMGSVLLAPVSRNPSDW